MTSKSEFSVGKDSESIESILKSIQNLSKESNIFDLVFISSKIRAETYLENKNFNKALHIFKFLRVYCRIAGKIEEEMMVAQQMGQMYRFSNNHSKAAEMFRIVLKYSWVLENRIMELKTYDNLSNEHFHMGNLNKSMYYSERFDKGLFESNLSRMKSSVVQPYRENKKSK